MAIDAAKLLKVTALLDSPNEGECAAALRTANKMLAAAGKRWRDLPAILGAPPAAPPRAAAAAPTRPATPAAAPQSFEDRMEEKEPGYKARCARAQAQRAQEQAAARAAVIEKYGSQDAAVAPSVMEATVDAAMAPFVREEMRQFSNGRFPRKTLDGWSSYGDPVPPHVGAAVRAALPLPTTLAEAKAETDAWHERERELGAIYGPDGDWLSLGCGLRLQIVTALLYHDLRATSLEDAIVRHRAIRGRGFVPNSEEADAMIADIEQLARMQAVTTNPVQSGRLATATDRRSEVLRLLSNLDTVALSDREIGRRVGVSPQTVGNLRRRFEGQGAAA
jgi:DNA-binding CsgD family transcriptional regulator